MSSSYGGGRSLPDGIDNYVAVILTAVIQTHKNIVQFNLNTKRFTLNPFPLCRKAILTMQLSPHLPRLQDYFDGHYFFPERHNVYLHVQEKPIFNPRITAMKSCYSKSVCSLGFKLKIHILLANFLTFKSQNAKHLRS